MSIKQKQPPVIPDRLELVVRGGRIVTPEGIQCADLGVLRGKIVQIAPEISEEADATLDAEGAYVFPGIMDAHVHFNEPGRADWEGLASGSAALAAGGGTCFFDMPLNSEPPVLDSAGLRVKRALAEERSCTDFALWGGLVPGNLNQLAGLKSAGAIGVKAFMCDSGIASFPRVDAKSLFEGMKRAAQLGLLVAVHAEDDALAAKFTAEQKARGKHDARAFLASRPVEVELAAIKRVLGPDLSGASMSSTKSAIGHLLGGAGAVETIFCVLAIRDQIVPPTLNLDNPDEGTEGVDLVPKVAKKRVVRAALNNSFGFGGTNASVIVKAI